MSLLEKGLIGGEQSSRNWGWVRQQNRDMFELPLAMYSLERWEAFSTEIGRDVGFRRNGIVYTTDSPESLAKWEAWGQQAREQGFISHMLSADEARGPSPLGPVNKGLTFIKTVLFAALTCMRGVLVAFGLSMG